MTDLDRVRALLAEMVERDGELWQRTENDGMTWPVAQKTQREMAALLAEMMKELEAARAVVEAAREDAMARGILDIAFGNVTPTECGLSMALLTYDEKRGSR